MSVNAVAGKGVAYRGSATTPCNAEKRQEDRAEQITIGKSTLA